MIGWDTNVLRRREDRLENLLVFVLVLTFLAAAPLLAWWAGTAGYRSDVRAREWERTHVFRVDAVLVEDATGTDGPTGGPTAAPQAARATWTAPDGSSRSGIVQTEATARAGARVAVWVDDAGRLHVPPGRHSPVSQAILLAVAAVMGLVGVLAVAHRTGRGLLDRRRDRAWAREWAEVGPRWSRDPRWR
ncbi:Rv1733c family protein [Actinoplanes sp. HUAS TT8]|uniref:Rv1733c family protein n=1 Tax=Actinoplanes sp. HUAS TT8 TaxID=3447453 RepID=UPI003F51B468